MPGLGARLRARWRALVDAAGIHPRRADGVADSAHADTTVVDLRPRVRMPRPDGEYEGPPAEWLEYVMAQDPVWVDGGLGLPGRSFAIPTDDITDPTADVSTLTSSSSAGPDDAGPVDERPRAVSRPGRRPRARFVGPPQPPDDESTPADPARSHTSFTYPATAADSTTPAAFPTPAHSTTRGRPSRRLLRPYDPATSGSPAATANPEPVVHTDRASRAAAHPDPPRSVARGDDPPRWPVAGSTSTPMPTTPPPSSADGQPAVAPPAATVVVHSGRTTLTAPSIRTLTTLPTSTAPARTRGRANAPAPETHLGPVVDPWTSTSSPAPVVELRRDLDDRPAAAEPAVALRWRAIDVDRLGIEQRAL